MGLICNFSCCEDYKKWKALNLMNKQGVYTPAQIEEHVVAAWESLAQSKEQESTPQANSHRSVQEQADFVDSKSAKMIVEEAVNSLGKIGDGRQFTEQKYTLVYKRQRFQRTSMFGSVKVSRMNLIQMVTQMMAKEQEK